ncbi:MAG: O-antigen ligase family protein [Clostridia bacterium]|nr:O-antigen ligase family protein [Clostridia bacterium]
MATSFEKIKRSKALDIIKNVISSKFLPFATAAVFLACYYLGWDIVAVYYLGIVTVLILLLLEDISPVISQLLFLNFFVSLKSVSISSADGYAYYSQTAILVQMIVIAALVIAALLYRLILSCVKRKFHFTPVFFGICTLCVAFLLNGLGSEYSTPNNLLFGFVMSALILGFFAAVKDNIVTDKKFYEKIAYGFMALSILLIIELIVAYATYDNLFASGTINRYELFFGWGGYNHYGLWIVMCLPSALYLAGIKKHGYLFTAYSFIIFAASMLCCSRQAMIVAAIIYPVCLIILLVKGKYRIPNLCITAVAVAIGIILICIFREKFVAAVKAVFENVFVNGELNGSGRWNLWKEAMHYFEDYPLFGAGFYIDYSYAMNAVFLPATCHNTILEIMATCGIVGLAAYLLHRVQTVICFFKNVTIERTLIALTTLVVILMSLLDMHIFNIFPTIIYACLIAALVKSQEKATVTDPATVLKNKLAAGAVNK